MTRLLTYVRRHHLGLLALFIALGGTSYAAVKLPNNSVGSAQIKAGAVGSREVRNGSLTSKDFKKGALPAGATGATGPQGPKGDAGATGAQGPAGKIETVAVRVQSGSTQTIANDDTATGTVPVSFGSASYDTSGFFDAGRTVPDFQFAPPPAPATHIADGNQVVRIPKTGLYAVSAGVRWASSSLGERSLAILSYATTTPPSVIAYSTVRANDALNAKTAQNVSTMDRLNEGDFVLLGVGQSSGGNLDLVGSQKQIHLAVTYLGP